MRMEKLLDKSRRLTKALQFCEMIVGVLCLFIMLVTMLINIFSRYLLLKPIAWSDELCNYLFVWMSFLASAYVMGNDNHVRVDAIESRLPKKLRKVIHLIMNFIMLVTFFMYIGPSFRMLDKLKLSNMLHLPLKIVYAIMPVCFVLMCVHILNTILQDIGTLFIKKPSAQEGEKSCC